MKHLWARLDSMKPKMQGTMAFQYVRDSGRYTLFVIRITEGQH